MTALEAACELAKLFEGIKDGDELKPGLQPYRDPVGYWTIGYGHLISHDRSIPQPDMTWTDEEAEGALKGGMAQRLQAVEKMTVDLSRNAIAALSDFAFNIGVRSLRASTLLRLANAGDIRGAGDEFKKWKFAGGVVLPGLIRRRAAERALFLS